MDDRKKRLFKILGIACIVFAAFIAYLMYFNFGLEISGMPGANNEGVQITVKNASLHAIRNIEVFVKDSNGSESRIMEVPLLNPGEDRNVLLSEIHSANGEVSIEARAPQHIAVSKKIKIESYSQESLEFNVEVEGNRKMFNNSQATFTVKACNLEHEDEEAQIALEFDATFFANIPSAESVKVTVKSGECIAQEFKMMPKALGKTTIAFNTTIEQINKRIEKEVEIIE